jgi:hypothetical protein
MMRGTQKLAELFQQVTDSGDSTVKKIVNIGDAYMEFFKTYPNYFRMFHFFQLPHFHKQVSEEMRAECNIGHKNLWDLVINLFKRAIDEQCIRPELNPVELTIILWSSATALMLRMDNEDDLWMKRMGIDLTQTLNLSNSLIWNSMLTEKGRTELYSTANT